MAERNACPNCGTRTMLRIAQSYEQCAICRYLGKAKIDKSFPLNRFYDELQPRRNQVPHGIRGEQLFAPATGQIAAPLTPQTLQGVFTAAEINAAFTAWDYRGMNEAIRAVDPPVDPVPDTPLPADDPFDGDDGDDLPEPEDLRDFDEDD